MPSLNSMNFWSSRTLCWIAVTLTACVYIVLFGRYRIENEDDAWYLSYNYNYLHKGIPSDFVYADGVEDGRWMSVAVFGKTHAFLYGPILDHLGWTKAAAHTVSIALILLSALLWRASLPRLGVSKEMATVFAVTLPLIEPFYSAANQARPDALVFFFLSSALYCASHQWFMAAGLLAALGFETHPMGLASAFVLTAALPVTLQERARQPIAWLRATALLVSGAILGGAYYVIIHLDALPHWFQTLQHGNASPLPGDNLLYQLFCETAYRRHLPELIAFTLAAILFLRLRLYKTHRFPALLFPLTMSMLLLVDRPNFFYALYFYPAFLLILLSVLAAYGWQRLFIAGWLILLLPQYTLVYARNHAFDMHAYTQACKSAIPDDGVPVFGSANDWFAFQNRDFRSTQYRGNLDTLRLDSFYVITRPDTDIAPALEDLLRKRKHSPPRSFSAANQHRTVLRANPPAARSR